MAKPEEYAAVEAALLKAITAEEAEVIDKVPPFLRGMIPADAAPKAAHAAAHLAVDTLDNYRQQHESSK